MAINHKWVCTNCLNEKTKAENSPILILLNTQKQKQATLEELIQNYNNENEIMDYLCEACKTKSKQIEKRNFQIPKNVKFLIIYFNRGFSIGNNENPQTYKDFCQITFDKLLQIESRQYKLKGWIDHLGDNLNAGHYISTIEMKNNEKADSFYEFNDESVKEITKLERKLIANKKVVLWIWEKIN